MYKEYEQKMERLAHILKIVKRVLIVLAIVVPVVLAVFYLIGFQLRPMKCDSVVYGETPHPKAYYTTLGDIIYEYKTAGAEDSEWSTEAPIFPGEYEVRARMVSPVGVKKESTTKFQIRPKELDIRMDEIIVYDDPHTGTVTEDNYEIGGLEYDDRISNVRVQIDESGSDLYLPYHLEDLRIVHADGTDAMDCYTVPEKSSQIRDARVSITVTAGSRSMVYDGDPNAFRDYDDWNITSGALNSGHTAEFHCEAEGSGEWEAINKIVSGGIKDADGNSVDYQYKIQYADGELKMTPRKLRLTSGDATKWYDGLPLTNPEYKTGGDGVAEGDTLTTKCIGSIVDPGKVPNAFDTITIASERFGNVKKYYDLETDEGILKVLLRVDETPNSTDSPYIGNGGQDGPDGGINIVTDGEEIQPVELDFDDSGYDLPSDESSGGSFAMDSGRPQKVFSFYGFSNRIYYFKLFSYGTYTGGGFSKDPTPADYKPWCEYLMGNAILDSGYGYRDVVRVKDLAVEYPVYPYSLTTDMMYSEDEKLYTSDTQFLWAFNSYPASFDSREQEYREFVHSSYMDVPSDVKEKLSELGDAAGLREGDPDLVNKIAEYIQNAATYSFKFSFPSDKDMVIYFLTEGKKGICQHFATAATLMYRTYGIPARYVVGFAQQGAPGRWTTMTTNDGHAWVEVYIDGSGWIPVEVTGQAEYEGGSSGEGDLQFGWDDEDEDQTPYITIVYDRYQKIYDGKKGMPVTLNGHLYGGRLRDGDKLVIQPVEVKEDEVLQRVGDNYFDMTSEAIRITDRNGNDVTDQYVIDVYGARYIVNARPLSIIVYGDYGENNSLWRMKRMQWTISDGSLAPGQKLDVYCDDRDGDNGFSYTLGNVGDYKICAQILDENGNNVTYNYDLYSPVLMDYGVDAEEKPTYRGIN